MEVLRQVAGRNSYIPSARPPFRQLVIGQSASRDGVNSLPAILALVGPKFENQSLSRPSGCLNDHVFARPQGCHCLLLPKVGKRDLVESGEIGKLLSQLRHAQKIPEEGRERKLKLAFCEQRAKLLNLNMPSEI